ncbi:MAG: OadG family protein, partial [Gudongella sp.]|nr:OadG family protein [Gudongella sp.]
MGEKVTMMEALVVTAVSMIVVFLVLILISYIIGLLKTLSTGKPKTVEKAQPVEQPVASTTPAAPVAVEAPDQGELIAVIAAAVAASLG